MNLEARYVVLKLKDMDAAGVTADEIAAFNSVCDKVSASRIGAAKGLLECLVIEKDWPEYQPTLAALSARVDGRMPADVQLDVDTSSDAASYWRDRYMREVEGLNNEGDPIGGEPAVGLRHTVERQKAALETMADDLSSATVLLAIAIKRLGGAMTVMPEDYEGVRGKSILGSVDQSSNFVLTLASPPTMGVH